MNAPVRLAAFGAGLAVVFGGALAVGDAAGPQRDRTAGAVADAHGMGDTRDGESMAAPPVRGLAVSADGLTLRLARAVVEKDTPTSLAFRIVGRDGRTVRDFDVEHTKRMHVIVVRRDLTGFQHVHPVRRADGSWAVPVTLGAAGTYRVFADFSVGGKPQTLADDLQVDGAVRSHELPAPARTTTVDGLTVTLAEGVDRAKGHLVALREGDLGFLHVHPDQNRLRFMATFPTAGRYRLFLQFQSGGRVHTAAFTQEVSR